MPKGRIIGVLLASLLGIVPMLSLAHGSVPDTPPGRALGAWLKAFNSGNRAREESFIKTYAWRTSLDDLASWRKETGGYDLLDIYSNDQTTVFFRVKAKKNGIEEVGRLTLSATGPAAVTELGTWRVPAGEKVDVVELDAAARSKVVERVAATFESFYVFPEIGKQMSADVRARDARGEYRSALYGIDLARQLSRDLREISHDKHVDVRFSFVRVPAELPRKTSEAEARQLLANNCGFEKPEHLPPNIGYLKFNGFADPEICAPAATAVMTLLADSDALILDLRDNTGGRAAMVDFIASYLFAGRTHLYDTEWRGQDAAQESWTSPSVPGRKFIGKPVYVLVSNRTFSAAEGLSCFLKDLKRATLIGETTAGGGHRINPKPIDDHFTVRVPIGRTLSPVTKTDWEGTGVEPDVKVAAAEALDVALKLARSR